MDPFHEHMVSAGLAPKTVATYVREVARARVWLAERSSDLAAAPPSLIAAYCDTFPRTNASRKMLRSAFSHWWRCAGVPNPPVGAVRVPPRPRAGCRALDEDEARILAKHARNRGDLPGLATCVGLYQAMRRAEIASLRGDHLRGGWLTIIGKGDVEARIPVHPVVAELLDGRGPGWVFPGRFGGPVCPATIWEWIGRVGADAGVPPFTPHQLRHTALATANDATGDLRSVQAFARHSSPATTAIYTRATATRLRAVVDSLDY